MFKILNIIFFSLIVSGCGGGSESEIVDDLISTPIELNNPVLSQTNKNICGESLQAINSDILVEQEYNQININGFMVNSSILKALNGYNHDVSFNLSLNSTDLRTFYESTSKAINMGLSINAPFENKSIICISDISRVNNNLLSFSSSSIINVSPVTTIDNVQYNIINGFELTHNLNNKNMSLFFKLNEFNGNINSVKICKFSNTGFNCLNPDVELIDNVWTFSTNGIVDQGIYLLMISNIADVVY